MKNDYINSNRNFEFKDVILTRLSDINYDIELSQNIALIPLYDSSVNNALLECIARLTPCLITKHPAIIELLGEDYPLYFTDENDCLEKLENEQLLYSAHLYIKNENIQNKIKYSTFLENF